MKSKPQKKNLTYKACPECGELKHPQDVQLGMCTDCEREHYPHGKILDSDWILCDDESIYNDGS
mgnify:FL=1|jgi:ribosomal protein S14